MSTMVFDSRNIAYVPMAYWGTAVSEVRNSLGKGYRLSLGYGFHRHR